MKSFLKTLVFFAACMVASVNLCSCSSSDDEEVMEEQTTFNVIGKWTSVVAQPLDETLSSEELKQFATAFRVAVIEFKNGGVMTWHEYDKVTGDPVQTENKGTYHITGNQITISAPGSSWMTGTHIIEYIKKYNDTIMMEWTINTSLGKGRLFLTPSLLNL